jgi:hypothetical protein
MEMHVSRGIKWNKHDILRSEYTLVFRKRDDTVASIFTPYNTLCYVPHFSNTAGSKQAACVHRCHKGVTALHIMTGNKRTDVNNYLGQNITKPIIQDYD